MVSFIDLPEDILRLIVRADNLDRDDLKNLRLSHSSLGRLEPILSQLFGKAVLRFDEHSNNEYLEAVGAMLVSPSFAAARSQIKHLIIFVDTLAMVSPMHLISGRPWTSILVKFLNSHETTLRRAFTEGLFPRLADVTVEISWFGEKCSPLPPKMPFKCVYDVLVRLDAAMAGTDIRLHADVFYLEQASLSAAKTRDEDLPYLSHMNSMLFRSPLWWPPVEDMITILKNYQFEKALEGFVLFSRGQGSGNDQGDLLRHVLEDTRNAGKLKRFSHLQQGSQYIPAIAPLVLGGLKELTLVVDTLVDLNFPWEAALKNGMRLEKLDISVISQEIIEYLAHTDVNTFRKLRVAVDIPRRRHFFREQRDLPLETVLGPYNTMAANLWLAIKRHQASLTHLKIDVWTHVDGESYLRRPWNLAWPREPEEDDAEETEERYYDKEDRHLGYVRLDAYMPWTPTGSEFAAADISFQRLEEAILPTVYTRSLGDFPALYMKRLILEGSPDPRKFRFEYLMRSITPCLRTLRLIKLKNITGVYKQAQTGREEVDSELEEESPFAQSNNNHGHWLRDWSDAVWEGVHPRILDYTFEKPCALSDGVRLRVQNMLGRGKCGPSIQRYVLKGGRWQFKNHTSRKFNKGNGKTTRNSVRKEEEEEETFNSILFEFADRREMII